MDISLIIIFVSILVLAYLFASISSFGGGLLSMPLLTIFLLPIMVVTGFLLNVDIIRTSYQHIHWRMATILSLCGSGGIMIGTYLLFEADKNLIEGILGGVVILASLNMIRTRPVIIPSTHPIFSSIFGLISRILQGAFNIGGSPLIIYLNGHSWTKATVRSIMVTVFAITGIIQLALLGYQGVITLPTVGISLALIPEVSTQAAHF